METMEGTRQDAGFASRDRLASSPPVTQNPRAGGAAGGTSATRSQATRSDVLPPPRRKVDGTLPLARGLGWFSIGLGLAELVAPRQLARFIGVTDNTTLIQAMGVREIAAGIGVLMQRRPTESMWARVAGDAVDLSLLAAATRQPGNDNARIAMAAAAVAGVTALDLVCAQKLSSAASEDLEAGDGQINVQKTMAVNRSAQELYSFWRNFENLPNFMKHLKSVTTRDARSSHWVATGPAGTTVEWDAEVTEDRPNELIAWRSLADADVQNSGVVRFVPEPARPRHHRARRDEIQPARRAWSAPSSPSCSAKSRSSRCRRISGGSSASWKPVKFPPSKASRPVPAARSTDC